MVKLTGMLNPEIHTRIPYSGVPHFLFCAVWLIFFMTRGSIGAKRIFIIISSFEAGENTLNVKLARELLNLLEQEGSYAPDSWLERMVGFLTSPDSHKDTYLEEYIRYFFTTHANNSELRACGRQDENHIGGYSLMLPLTIACSGQADYARKVSLEHLALTHGGPSMRTWGTFIVSILLDLLKGNSMKDVGLFGNELSALQA
jgi:hypothetical protein